MTAVLATPCIVQVPSWIWVMINKLHKAENGVIILLTYWLTCLGGTFFIKYYGYLGMWYFEFDKLRSPHPPYEWNTIINRIIYSIVTESLLLLTDCDCWIEIPVIIWQQQFPFKKKVWAKFYSLEKKLYLQLWKYLSFLNILGQTLHLTLL